MASFVIHVASAEKLVENLNLTDEDKAKFYAGNLVPDMSFLKDTEGLPERERRHLIQNEKIKSHFRTDLSSPFQYPDVDFFLEKYHEEVKHDPMLLGIMYHLYIDCLFYRDYMNENVTVLDENKEVTKTRDKMRYMKINKTGDVVDTNEFFSYHGGRSIYEEYNKLNEYLLEYYSLGVNIDKYIEILRDLKIDTNIPEVNVSESYNVMLLFKAIITNAHKDSSRVLNIFSEENIISFIEESYKEFINKYQDIYNSYK